MTSGFEQGGVLPAFKTKADLKRAIKEGREVKLHSTSAFGGFHGTPGELPEGVVFTVVGPDPHTSRKWYANVTRRGGRVVVS